MNLAPVAASGAVIAHARFAFDTACPAFLQWPSHFARKEGRTIEHSVSAAPAIVQVEGLCFHYPQRRLFERWSARISSGVTLVRGGDGSGKSSLLRLLAGELPAAAGRLQINDICLNDQPEIYRQQVFWSDPWSEAFDHISATTYFQSLQRRYPAFDQALLADLIAGLALAPHLDKQLYMLSTGSKRKVWLAAAFASGAALTLLDDPFAALDRASASFVAELLRGVAAQPTRAWVIGDYAAPADVPLAAVIELGD